jgi:hypothetical protein
MGSHCKGTAGENQPILFAEPGAAFENSDYSHQGPTVVAEKITEGAAEVRKQPVIASQ